MIEEIKDTSASLWISASAGTGKTKNLIDRILALLLKGVIPSHILCLTYTKAAATEMQERLRNYFQQMESLSDNEVLNELTKIGFNDFYLSKVRELSKKSFEKEWVNIQTIHSFSLKLLEKFPLETGLFPGTKQCDDYKKQQLLEEAFYYALRQEELYPYLKIIAHHTYSLINIFQDYSIILIRKFLNRYPQDEDIKRFFMNSFEVNSDILTFSSENLTDYLLHRHFGTDYRIKFSRIIQLLTYKGDKTAITDKKAAKCLQNTLDFNVDDFKYAVLTKELKPKKDPFTKGVESEELKELFRYLLVCTNSYLEEERKIESAKVNIAFFIVVKDIINYFYTEKFSQHIIDFDDMILQTIDLLRDNLSWVFYKIDKNIEHILVDEAQDTSAEQWQVIEMLTSDFFTVEKSPKTVFIVGDEKQSIYSFQGADISLFQTMKQRFKQKSEACGQNFYTISLDTSFRSDGNILKFVDSVFSHDFPNIKHISYHNENEGVVEIADLFSKEDEGLSEYIANIIATAIENKLPVKQNTRAAEPRDFLILFRHRDIDSMNSICEALKKRNIPVSGVDRVLLKEEPVIEDLIALGEFVDFPLDDLMCARVLKSPLIRMSEEDLMTICLDRKEEHLWHYLLANKEMCNKYQIDVLSRYVSLKLSCYDFFSYVLIDGLREKFLNVFGEKCINIINEFLNTCLNYEKNYSPLMSDFLRWFDKFDQTIKREYAGNDNKVRLMTVHGSKGLQAPFVILADSDFNHQKSSIILHENNQLFWNFNKMQLPNDIQKLLESDNQAQKDESQRLLYVALTRAESFLYIVGNQGKKSDNWYHKIINSDIIKHFVRDKNVLRLGNYPQNFTQNIKPITKESDDYKIPDWFYQKEEIMEFQPVESVKAEEAEFEECVHLLLKNLSIYGAALSSIADEIMENFSLSKERKQEALTIALRALDKFPYLFTSDTKSEVSFFFNGQEGSIDKIAKIRDELWIIEFKTGTPQSIIPQIYINELRYYQKVYYDICHQRTKAAIFWIENMSLVPC